MKKSPGSGKEAKPLQNKEEVQKNSDEHIDQDFPGYPHAPSQEKTINPKTAWSWVVTFSVYIVLY